jgi:hypothetical protein
VTPSSACDFVAAAIGDGCCLAHFAFVYIWLLWNAEIVEVESRGIAREVYS